MSNNAFSMGFLSYIKNSSTTYANNCYELLNIDIELDKDTIDILKNYVDIITDDDTFKTSFTIEDSSVLRMIEESFINFDNYTNEDKKEFIRGIYEYNYLCHQMTNNNNDIKLKKRNDLTTILDFTKIPYDDSNEDFVIIKSGCNATDFLGFIYSNNIKNSFKVCNYNLLLPQVAVFKTDENAIIPFKTNASDVGYDLTIIKKIKDFNSKTCLYDTCIKIQVDFGYYAEIVPRSSLSKSGYMLANSIGIIDNSYRGNLMIALTKIADDAPELELPFKCCQLIIKKQVYTCLNEIEDEEEFNNTRRGEGGFGST
jgi:deoxyuridine 5'-triphosphate nucleotidohydrolase